MKYVIRTGKPDLLNVQSGSNTLLSSKRRIIVFEDILIVDWFLSGVSAKDNKPSFPNYTIEQFPGDLDKNKHKTEMEWLGKEVIESIHKDGVSCKHIALAENKAKSFVPIKARMICFAAGHMFNNDGIKGVVSRACLRCGRYYKTIDGKKV